MVILLQVDVEKAMLKWAAIFLVVALIAGLLGLEGVAVIAGNVALWLFVAFLVIAAILFFLGLYVYRKIT